MDRRVHVDIQNPVATLTGAEYDIVPMLLVQCQPLIQDHSHSTLSLLYF